MNYQAMKAGLGRLFHKLRLCRSISAIHVKVKPRQRKQMKNRCEFRCFGEID